MNKPVFLVGMALILVVALGMAFRRDDSNFSTDTLVSLVAFGMMMALIGRFVVARFQGNASTALRDITIWGVLIALVALIYTNKAGLGL